MLSPLDLDVTLVGFGQSIDGTSIELDPSEQTQYMANFLKPSLNSLRAIPGRTENITLSGDVPNDIGSGGRFALLVVKSKPLETEANVGVALAVNIPVILTISGADQKMIGEITSLEPTDPITAEHQTFTAIFNNTGDYYYKIQSKADLKDSSGIVVANATNPVGSSSIVPPNARRIKFNLAPPSPLPQARTL